MTHLVMFFYNILSMHLFLSLRSFLGCSDITVTAANNNEVGDDSNDDNKNNVIIENEDSGVSVLFILFTLSACFYTVGGFAYNYKYHEKIEHPHEEQWKKVGNAVWTGGKYVGGMVKDKIDEARSGGIKTILS